MCECNDVLMPLNLRVHLCVVCDSTDAICLQVYV